MKTWVIEHRGVLLGGVGKQQLLALPLAAFFASRQCPGSAIRASLDWALTQAKNKKPVIGSFHSSLEQSVLKLLLEGGGPAIVVLARPIKNAALPKEWLAAIAKGTLAVISQTTAASRLTSAISMERNNLVATLAEEIVVGYASAGGQLMGALNSWRSLNKRLTILVEDQ